jgi:hypothetical protein
VNARLIPSTLSGRYFWLLDDLQLNPEEWTRPAALEFERVPDTIFREHCKMLVNTYICQTRVSDLPPQDFSNPGGIRPHGERR